MEPHCLHSGFIIKMWSLYMTLLLLGFTSSVYMETCPAEEDISPCDCEEEDESGDIMVTCSDESLNLETLRKSLSSLSGKNDVDLALSDFKIGKLPSNFFYGIGIKRLDISHCDLDSLTNDDQPGFLGLENYLEVRYFCVYILVLYKRIH